MKDFLRHLWESKSFYLLHLAFLATLSAAFYVLVLQERSWFFIPVYLLLGLPDVWRNWKAFERNLQEHKSMARFFQNSTMPIELRPENIILSLCLTALLWPERRLTNILSLYRTKRKWVKILKSTRLPHDE